MEQAQFLDRFGTPLDPRVITRFCLRHHIRRLSLLTAGQRSPASFAMLVEFDPSCPPGRFHAVAMEIELSNLAGRRIDLKTSKDLRDDRLERLIPGAQLIYASQS